MLILAVLASFALVGSSTITAAHGNGHPSEDWHQHGQLLHVILTGTLLTVAALWYVR